MNLYNTYMENLRKSKQVALDLLEDTKDIYDGISVESPTVAKPKNIHINLDVEAGPSTSVDKPKRPTEFVKYGKITFNTTAILHHYPQLPQNKACTENCKPSVATKKSDLNLPVDQSENNNDVVDKEPKEDRKDTFNNNETPIKVASVVNADKTVEVLKKPVKFTEEKLV
jgi:hypothetical protein